MSKARPEPKMLPKRFYERVAFDPMELGFAILLDGKQIKTPAKKILTVPTEKLAAAIVAEWEAQEKVIDTDRMPLTRLANIALDRVAADRELLLIDISGYGETDLVCYRMPMAANDSESRDGVLRARQDAAFDPLLRWMHRELGIALDVTEGIMPVPQSAHVMTKIAAVFAAANDQELAALAMLVPLLGSAAIAIALWKKKLDVETALTIARLDEDFQAEQWGMDADTALNWDAKTRDIRAAVFYLEAQA